jgi:nucleotide-binding universal stress UspA family protein
MRTRGSVIVAGVDGSPAGVRALEHAFTEARRRGGSVELVTVWTDLDPRPAGEFRCYRAGHRWAAGAQRDAVARVSLLGARLPPLTGVVAEGDPASVLARAGVGAACIVLGSSPGDSWPAAHDSVRERCTALASCLVLVVPPPAALTAHAVVAAAR